MDDCWRTRAVLDLAALRHNLAVVRKLAPACKIMAVLKANAYGHGMARISGALADRVQGFAVASVAEGIRCRRALASAAADVAADVAPPIALLSGLQHASDLVLCRRHQLAPVAHTAAHVEWLAQYRGTSLTAWLKIDSGMHRLGIAPQQVAEAVARLRANRCLARLGLMSHLAAADAAEHSFTERQLAIFTRATDAHQSHCELGRSLANSAAVLQHPQTHFQWVRPGLMLYGVSPLRDTATAADMNLRPVMQLESRLLAIKQVAAGQPVGYGGAFVTAAPTRLGIVGIGYGDGYPWSLSSAAEVLIGDTRAPLIGPVAMDMLTVDLSHCKAAAVGDPVLLWGKQLRVEEVANWAGTLPYELLSRVSARVPRVVVEK